MSREIDHKIWPCLLHTFERQFKKNKRWEDAMSQESGVLTFINSNPAQVGKLVGREGRSQQGKTQYVWVPLTP